MILFFKAVDPDEERDRSEGDEALEKIRAIFEARVKEAKTDEDRERAERELRKVSSGS
jgi:hypothetical protein